MPDITVSPPSLDLQAYFTFKEPVLTYIKNKLNTSASSILLKVIGINNLKSMIESELRDPFTDAYAPIGITGQEYKKDVLNSVPLYVLAYTSPTGRIVYVKCPLNYINDFSLTTDTLYTNRVIVIDLKKLPELLDTTTMFEQLSDLVFDSVGVRPEIKEVSVGEPEKVTQPEYEIRESIRTQGIIVAKSNRAKLAEITLKHDQLLSRINSLNIVLG